VILVDSNVPMYLVGPVHPRKTDAPQTLERLVAERERLVTDAPEGGPHVRHETRVRRVVRGVRL